MPAQDLSRLGLRNGFSPGENGWGEEAFNYNFNKLSSLIHISIKAMNTRVPSSNDPVGTAYIVGSSPYGHFSGISTGWIAYRDLSSPAPTSGTSPARWYFQQPITGMIIYNEADNLLYVYDNGWAIVRPPFTAGRWYKTSNQVVNTNATSTIVWGATEFQRGVSRSSNILNIPDAGFYDIRLQTNSNRGNGGGTTTISIRNAGSNKTLASAANYSAQGVPQNEFINCSWIGYLGANSQIDFRMHSSEGPTTMLGGDSQTFFDCKRID